MGKEESLESFRLRCLEWITTAFSETVIAWTHLKAIRLFVESVLRFGLPVSILLLDNILFFCCLCLLL